MQKAIIRGNCRNCARHYTAVVDDGIEIFKTENNKWAKLCSGCSKVQEYTRKDHAKQSFLNDWQCKNCVQKSKRYSENRPIGDFARIFNKFKKSSQNRGIEWNLSIEDIQEKFNGLCSLTGWNISVKYNNCNASIDRIDSKLGYTINNIQWVHKDVNMCKGHYSQDFFIKMCSSIHDNFKK